MLNEKNQLDTDRRDRGNIITTQKVSNSVVDLIIQLLVLGSG